MQNKETGKRSRHGKKPVKSCLQCLHFVQQKYIMIITIVIHTIIIITCTTYSIIVISLKSSIIYSSYREQRWIGSTHLISLNCMALFLVLVCKNAASIACIVFRYFNRKTIIAMISKTSHAIAV